ncbi:hypothetical protein SERLA73DRAFT_57794 [Serpula lacrymans var. lacrymans S7.3]|uniref:Oxidoreductase AflY n=2 Tax=Serpula lacrymans var. lacrymans TaxID=341189 RepID=F8Q2K9_SERL3|nr:uncharacterized protein SERLADRAFT_439772 [Serpula lacrymans var. lacrymans S7.9]EGN97420.1 hypothetical protein SERLA73DRAFT_57794 [Serpula lacrymans var. lacrymans S7.3]EGO23011.1 hypothetical protein SERLADRAFT_439772 [Serpula lacrymans var. lacrymans S7.9]
MSSESINDRLFPQPGPPPSLLSPKRWPGSDPEATTALQEVLTHNNKEWHIFFNDKGFHNHAAHHLLAIWALGASAPVIKAAYQTHCDYQLPAYKSPEPITTKNFNDHLGDEDYYNAYLIYFTDEISKNGLSKVLENHVFSMEANIDDAAEAQGKQRPDMLCRFVEGVFHPFIHVGYGAEFGLLGIAAEGMAMTAVHPASSSVLMPRNFSSVKASSLIEIALEQLSRLSLNTPYPPPPSQGVHAFTILARMLKDKRFDNVERAGPDAVYNKLLKDHGDVIREYADLWKVDTSDPQKVEDHIEQLIWVNTMTYGIGGWKEGQDFNADFFGMHFVTSVLFVPSILVYLSHHSKALLLKAYFVMSLSLWIARGRVQLDISAFFDSTSTMHTPPGAQPSPVKKTLPTPDSQHALTPNAWLPIIQTTIVHPNEHLCKLQRALAHFAAIYGTRKAGYFHGTELEGADKLDGTLFVRVATLTADRLAWMREGQDGQGWDFKGFFTA